jgi:hypothetical protein
MEVALYDTSFGRCRAQSMLGGAPANSRADPLRLAGPAPIVLDREPDIAEAAGHCNKPRR